MNNYSTTRLNLAAYLVAAQVSKLVEVRNNPGSTYCEFVLSPHPTKQQVDSFFNDSATVSALTYSKELTNLRSAMHEVRNV